MREMKDSGIEWIGRIPYDWNIRRLKYIKAPIPYAIVDGPFGSAISTEDYVDEGVPLVRIVNIAQPGLTEDNIRYITTEHAEKVKRSSTHLGDIILAKTGATVGKCGINDLFDFAILSSSCIKISIDSRFDSKYFYYLFFTDQFNEALRNACNGTTRDTINLKPFGEISCCVPSLEKQKQIVEFLDEKIQENDALIANVQLQIEKLKTYKQSVITEVVTKGLDPTVPMKDSGVEWIGEIANTRTIYRLKYLLGSPMQYGANESGDKFTEDSVRYIRITDITADGKLKDDENNQYLPMSVANEYILKDKDVLFARSGGTVGKSFLYHENYGKSAFAGYLIKAECDQTALLPEYLIYYTQSSLYELWKNMIFIQATIQNIGANKYSNMEIPVPPVDEQKAIVEHLAGKCSQIDRLIALKEAKIEKLEQYKKSLIYEYVTGKREV